MSCNLRHFQFSRRLRLIVGLFCVALAAASSQAAIISITPGVAGAGIDEFAVSPDGTKVAFVGELNNGQGAGDQTFIMSIAGGSATLLSPTTGDIDGGLAFLPDGSAVITRWDNSLGNSNNQFYSYPTTGSQVGTQLTFNSYNGFDGSVSADGATLFFVASGVGADGDLLHSASISSPGPTEILITPDDTAELDGGGYALVGSDVVYAGSLPGEVETRFYRIASDGSGVPTEILVSNFPGPTGDIDQMTVTPDGQTIVFVGDLTTDGVDELYSMPIGGGLATQLLPSIPDFADVSTVVVSPDGATLAFIGDYAVNQDFEAYVMPLAGGTPIRVSDDLTGVGFNADVVGGVGRLAFTPDSQSVLYLADSQVNGVNELHLVSNPLYVPEPGAVALLGIAVVARLLGQPVFRRR